MNSAIKIRSDDDAWALLERLLDVHAADQDDIKIELLNWPLFDMTSDRGGGHIDTSTMKSFLALEEGLFRTFLTFKEGSRDLRSLSDSKRHKLEFAVKVKDGSSLFSVKLDEQIKQLVSTLSDKLSSRDIVVIILLGGLLWAGQSVWKQHISEAAKVRIAETQSEERAAVLQTLVDLSKEETERLEILEIAYDEIIETRVAEYESGLARQEFLRNLPTTDKISIEGIDLEPQAIEEIVKSERQISTEDIDLGTFSIERMHVVKGGAFFKVWLKNIATQESFSAVLADGLMPQEDYDLLHESFKKKTPVSLRLETRKRGEVITSAKITKVSNPSPE